MEERFGDRTWLIVADRRLVAKHPGALRGLSRRRRDAVVALAGGEPVKRLSRLDALAKHAHHIGLDRQGLVIGLGGGTIGDLAGFFASIWMRGVDWVPVATTTLALADSAVGGKTAVDWRGLKNLLGSFHDPIAVYGVLEALETLPLRHYRAGLAEVVKSAVIGDAALFRRLEREADAIRRPGSDQLAPVLDAASRVKIRIVTIDPRERGERMWLNFGHTVGHALETSQRPRLHHGEAVAAGMIAASWLSERLVGAPEDTKDRVAELLGRLGVLRGLSPVDDITLWRIMTSDKKSRRGKPRVVLTTQIGSATVADLPPRPILSRAIQYMQQRTGSRATRNST
jgi:3-dehydroquinate synthetase